MTNEIINKVLQGRNIGIVGANTLIDYMEQAIKLALSEHDKGLREKILKQETERIDEYNEGFADGILRAVKLLSESSQQQ